MCLKYESRTRRLLTSEIMGGQRGMCAAICEIGGSRFRWISNITLKAGNPDIPNILAGWWFSYRISKGRARKSRPREIGISLRELGGAHTDCEGNTYNFGRSGRPKGRHVDLGVAKSRPVGVSSITLKRGVRKFGGLRTSGFSR